jgi:hypothetical protein
MKLHEDITTPRPTDYTEFT